jgi:DNA processing protein
LVGAVTPEQLGTATRDLKTWRQYGYGIHTVLDENYPLALLAIFNRPPLLFVAGGWDTPESQRAVAVVGARKATPQGIRRAQRLTRALVEARFTILSGLAAGIDTAAHTTALDAGGTTSAVMGTGLNRRFPKENARLADQILERGGALISQFFPAQPPATWTFPMRNVVMSGLSLATVVVEAGETSGARLQARVALQHGRTVFLLQSLVEQHAWAQRYATEGAYGTHAIAVSSPDEIIDRLEGRFEPSPIVTA